MALISIRKTAAIEPSPTDTVSLYVDAADNHLKQIDETGEIIDLTDGSATSSPNAASLVNTTKAALVTLLGGGLANIKATYRITDAADGIIRVTAKTASLLTATAMKEGSDDGGGTVTNGEWGNYDLDADVFASSATSGTFNPTATAVSGISSISSSSGKYTRVGDIVTGGCLIITVLSSSTASYNFRLPIPCSEDFTDGKQVVFSVSCKTPTDEWTEYSIQSETGSTEIIVNILAAGTVKIEMYIMFTYSITL